MKRFYFSSLMLLLALVGQGQYFQNFNTLTDTGNGAYDNLPLGWGIYEVGSGVAADGKYTAGTGSINTGNVYSFGIAEGDSERAFGTLSSGSNFPIIGARFVNETVNPITSVTISYTGEQWRYGGRSTGIQDTLRFEYSLDATGIVESNSTWTRVNQLDFLSVVSSGLDSTGTKLDGNAPENNQAITYSITGLNLQPGQSIVVRWSDLNIAGFDDGLAIDDFSILEGLTPETLTSGSSLPIALTYFNGVISNENTLLQWKTATEINALQFEVERSPDAKDFKMIGIVKATGAGLYSFTDYAFVKGVNYYRLKQVDKDGKFEYSNIIKLNPSTTSIFTFSPNPSTGNVKINVKAITGEKLLVQVFDAAGKIVYNKSYTGVSPIDLNLSNLANGTYVIRVNQNVSKLVISK